MLDKVECPIRLLEVEAETSVTQAKRFAELASYTNAREHKLKLETLTHTDASLCNRDSGAGSEFAFSRMRDKVPEFRANGKS